MVVKVVESGKLARDIIGDVERKSAEQRLVKEIKGMACAWVTEERLVRIW
jgi:hypothetical protein